MQGTMQRLQAAKAAAFSLRVCQVDTICIGLNQQSSQENNNPVLPPVTVMA